MNKHQEFQGMQKRIVLTAVAASLLLAWLSKQIGIHGEINFFIVPTAKLLDRISGESSHGTYFASMLLVSLAISIWTFSSLRRVVQDEIKRPGLVVAGLVSAVAFSLYLTCFIPEEYPVTGGRFSLLLTLAANSWFVLGLAYGLLFLAISVFSALLIATVIHILKKGIWNV